MTALMLGIATELMSDIATLSAIAPNRNVPINRSNESVAEYDKTFSKAELGIIAKEMGKDFTLRMSPQGNPIVTHRQTQGNNVIFSFYKREDGIIIRRRLGYANPFGSGNVLNGGKAFATISDAMRYFNEYKEKYPQSIVG